MNAVPATSRAISAVKVDAQPGLDGPGRVTVQWTDAANSDQREIYYGFFADQFMSDFRAVSLLGEDARQSYLIGRIREVQRLRGG